MTIAQTSGFMIVLFTSSLLAQATAPATNTTRGSCSPAVSGNNNTFTINCQGLTKEQAQDFLAMLKKISSNALDPKVVIAMLDELISNTRSIKSDVSEIRKEQLGRRLSDERSLKLARYIRGISPKQAIVIELVNGTAESSGFAEQLAGIFETAGWQVSIQPSIGFGSGILKGHSIAVKSGDNSVAADLQRVFKENGIDFPGTLKQGIPKDEIHFVAFGIP